jgi:hypothetical protein
VAPRALKISTQSRKGKSEGAKAAFFAPFVCPLCGFALNASMLRNVRRVCFFWRGKFGLAFRFSSGIIRTMLLLFKPGAWAG